MIAVVRIKGRVGVNRDIEKTLHLLRLRKKHACVILPNSEEVIGMLNKVQHYVTWGEINEETLVNLLKKRGRIAGNKRLTDEYLKSKIGKNIEEVAKDVLAGNLKLKDIPGVKPFFRLKPPTRGFRDLKKPFSMGGDYGYRGEHINELLKRMI